MELSVFTQKDQHCSNQYFHIGFSEQELQEVLGSDSQVLGQFSSSLVWLFMFVTCSTFAKYMYSMFCAIMCQCLLCTGDLKPPISGPPPGEFEGASSRPQDSSNPSGPSDIPSSKPAWYDPQHIGPWTPNQPVKTHVCLACLCANTLISLGDTFVHGKSPN